ncbi:MAG TPA: hypothetical protein VJ945_03090 [Flavobacteriaceae bacterium]|nr:hypothetical protein [Flavobacteriaceae bacterium]
MTLLDRFGFKSNAFVLGLLISFFGSLPLGYINVIGVQILLEQGNLAMVPYIFGIVFIDFFVLKITGFSAKWLIGQKKLLFFIDIFNIAFLGSIALYFIINIGSERNFSSTQLWLLQYPFILGVFLNSLNVVQWPYWSGVYLYLFRTKRLKTEHSGNYIFIIGALLGTLIGMLAFAHTSKYVLATNEIQINRYLNPIFGILFMLFTTVQIAKIFLKKYKK